VLTGILLPLIAGAILLKTGAQKFPSPNGIDCPRLGTARGLNWPPSPLARLPSRFSAGSTTSMN
jgi:hypothetical protein